MISVGEKTNTIEVLWLGPLILYDFKQIKLNFTEIGSLKISAQHNLIRMSKSLGDIVLWIPGWSGAVVKFLIGVTYKERKTLIEV